MPYIRKRKCVYKKDTGKKVGCSKNIATAKKYLRALHINTQKEASFDILYRDIIQELHSYNNSGNK